MVMFNVRKCKLQIYSNDVKNIAPCPVHYIRRHEKHVFMKNDLEHLTLFR